MNKRAKPLSVARLQHSDSGYPTVLREYLSGRVPKTLTALGNFDILQRKKLALFCSVKCPGALILQTYDLARALRDAGVAVIGSFHSPMEKECLTLLLRGTQPVIVCPARSIERMRTSDEWKAALAEGRLLILSPFGEKFRRITTPLAQKRNEFVAALADAVFVVHAAPGSKTERFCCEVLTWGKPLLTLESDDNAGLLALGATPVRPANVSEWWAINSAAPLFWKKETGMALATVQKYLKLLPIVKQTPQGSLWSSYDAEADVLYINVKKPSQATDSELTDDDVIVRYEGDEIIGFTILHASQRWWLGSVMLKVSYDKGTDSLTITLREECIKESDEICPGVIADFGYDGIVVRFEIMQASKVVGNTREMQFTVNE